MFPNLIRLTIDVDQEWSLECIQYLSTIIDLSRLEKLTFNPDLNIQCIRNTIDSISILMELAYNLNTLAIHPFSSYNGIENMETICKIIPKHIKYLEITVQDLDTMKIILNHHQYLWSLTLLASSNRSMPWSDFLNELINRKKDFVYWESYFSLHIWFDHTTYF